MRLMGCRYVLLQELFKVFCCGFMGTDCDNSLEVASRSIARTPLGDGSARFNSMLYASMPDTENLKPRHALFPELHETDLRIRILASCLYSRGWRPNVTLVAKDGAIRTEEALKIQKDLTAETKGSDEGRLNGSLSKRETNVGDHWVLSPDFKHHNSQFVSAINLKLTCLSWRAVGPCDLWQKPDKKEAKSSTQRLQCSSFLVMTYFLLRGYNILPKQELHLSLWVVRQKRLGLLRPLP